MSDQMILAEEQRDMAPGEPPSLTECLTETADLRMLQDRLTHDVGWALDHFSGKSNPATGRIVLDADRWRSADCGDLARYIAVHLVAGIDPVLREQVLALMDPLIEAVQSARDEPGGSQR